MMSGVRASIRMLSACRPGRSTGPLDGLPSPDPCVPSIRPGDRLVFRILRSRRDGRGESWPCHRSRRLVALRRSVAHLGSDHTDRC